MRTLLFGIVVSIAKDVFLETVKFIGEVLKHLVTHPCLIGTDWLFYKIYLSGAVFWRMHAYRVLTV